MPEHTAVADPSRLWDTGRIGSRTTGSVPS